jgi:hypothetical protein
MRKLFIAAMFAFSAATAHAGSVTFEAPQDVHIEVHPNFGIGGRWIIPTIIVSVIALAIANQNSCPMDMVCQ